MSAQPRPCVPNAQRRGLPPSCAQRSAAAPTSGRPSSRHWAPNAPWRSAPRPPASCARRRRTPHIGDIESYNDGDQGYLNEVFSWWHGLPSHANYMKHFSEGGHGLAHRAQAPRARRRPARRPSRVYFVGLKPWFFFRDYQCNWNVPALQQFASDEAHARWCKVHDAMPRRLQGFCQLEERQKALLRWDVARARDAKTSPTDRTPERSDRRPATKHLRRRRRGLSR
ncbi:hypothetical protein U9M48_044617 [Paspalum notatum var. saurae]|uniref:Uncharacterized protein n=1 Tax=Paspalum notatum var. saurae TaxID=547442 RepID=A0AAQ3UXG5_PASNO